MRKIIILIFIIAAVVGVYYLTLTPEGKEDFSKSGHLIINDSGEYSLLYEEPGAPALSAELNFTDETKCFKDSQEKPCREITFKKGDLVEVKGYYMAEKVNISEISFNHSGESNLTEISLFYYNSENDKDEQGNVLCSEKGLVPIKAFLPSDNIIKETIQLLIQGNVPEGAKNEGVSTEYPLEGFELKEAENKNGVLTLTFVDPYSKTTGGACRTTILYLQIEKTAKQFADVKEVVIKPDYLFQP